MIFLTCLGNYFCDLATCTVASKELEIIYTNNYRWINGSQMREIWKNSIVDLSRLIFGIFRDNGFMKRIIDCMAIRVVQFSNGGYKIRKNFA